MHHVKVIKKSIEPVELSDDAILVMFDNLNTFLHKQFDIVSASVKTPQSLRKKLTKSFERCDDFETWQDKANSLYVDVSALECIEEESLHYVDEDAYPHLNLLYLAHNAACSHFGYDDDRIDGTQLTIDVLSDRPLPSTRQEIGMMCLSILSNAYEDPEILTKEAESPIYEHIEDMFDVNIRESLDLGGEEEQAINAILWDIETNIHGAAKDYAAQWPESSWRHDVLKQLGEDAYFARYIVLTHRQWVKHIRRPHWVCELP